MAPMLVVALVHKAAIHAMFDHTVKRRIACKVPLVARGPLDVRDAQSEHHQRRQEKEQVGQALRRARELGRFLLDARRAPVDEGTYPTLRVREALARVSCGAGRRRRAPTTRFGMRAELSISSPVVGETGPRLSSHASIAAWS